MSHRNRRNGLAALAIVAGLAGCTVSSPRATSPGFALAPVLPGQATSTQANAAAPTAPLVPAAAAAPRASHNGMVTVSFASLLPARERRLFATLADVDHVTVVLTPSGGTAQQVTVAKAQITSGQVSATFSNVPPGSATFAVTVSDAGGKTIGSGSGTIQVTAGQVTTVNASIQLDHVLVPTPVPAGGGSGGGSTATTGSVQSTVGIVDGQNIQPLTLDTTLHVDNSVQLYDVTPGASGTFWATEADSPAGIIHFDRTGALLSRYVAGKAGMASIAVASNGDIVAKELNGGTLYRVKPDGTPVATLALGQANDKLGPAMSPNGDVWGQWLNSITGGQTLQKVDATGKAVTVTSNVNGDLGIAADSTGAVVSLDYPSTSGGGFRMTKYAADGSVVWTVSPDLATLNPSGLGIAPDDTIWVLAKATEVGQDFRLVKYGTDGKQLASFPLPAGLGGPGTDYQDNRPVARLQFDATGNLYLFYDRAVATTAYLVKVGADGTLKGIYYAPDVMPGYANVALDGAGDLIVACGDVYKGTPGTELFYKLP